MTANVNCVAKPADRKALAADSRPTQYGMEKRGGANGRKGEIL